MGAWAGTSEVTHVAAEGFGHKEAELDWVVDSRATADVHGPSTDQLD